MPREKNLSLHLRDRLIWGLAVGGEILNKPESAGSRAYSLEKLFLWTPVGYSRKKFRHLVSRMEREGFLQKVLIEGKVHCRLSDVGRKQLLRLYPVLQLQVEQWDGFWRLVVFDVSESKRGLRDELRRQLIKLGLGHLQSSVYLSAYEFPQEFLQWLATKGLSQAALLLESRQKYLGKPKALAEKVWQLAELAGGYNRIIDRLTTRFGIKEESKREEFLKKVYQDYLQILIKDPFLPQELLPVDWPADKAKKFVLRAGVVKE